MICSKCNKDLDDSFFPKKRKMCQPCINEKSQEWSKQNKLRKLEIQRKYREANRQKLRDSNKTYYKNNNELIKYKQKTYYNKNPDVVRMAKAKYRNNNKEKCNSVTRKCMKIRLKESPKHRMIKNLRGRLYHAMIKGKGQKSKPTIQLLGCSVDQCKIWITNQFTGDMSWENYGKYTWNIDHIIPCHHFNMLDIKEQEKCFHHTNLQPLSFEEHSHKQYKLPKDFNFRVWDDETGWNVVIYAA